MTNRRDGDGQTDGRREVGLEGVLGGSKSEIPDLYHTTHILDSENALHPSIVIHIIQALYQYVVFLQYHINPFTAYYHTVLLHRYLKEDFLKYVKHHSEN